VKHDIEEIYTITRYLQQNKIKCFKYNYNLDADVQRCTSFQSTLQLSPDSHAFILTNRIPKQSVEYGLTTGINGVMDILE
jgi:hypothetical protein